ncbi:hypothetical protein DFJ58DRAFT_668368, partial [Suillus subalutaceus]|uniref:uncharacterized protein n=1 Tax=Suillus subalutaceus TaxID=48586 RepID=UPI001B85B5B5
MHLSRHHWHSKRCSLYSRSICDGIQSRQHCMFFVEGRPGRGKTFMVNALSSTLRAEGHIILIVGSSALCATAYKRGRSAHYLF